MNLQTRVVNILTKPASEWPVIAAEPTDVVGLYRDYIAILAAIPAVATLIGLGMIGTPFIGTLGFGFALRAALVNYVSALVSAFVAAFIIEKLAPNFGSSGDTAQALKLVAYSSTPVWIAGVLNLIPVLAVLILVAVLYAIYLFYLGLPPVMKTPSDKVVPYMIVSAIVIIVVYVVLGAIMAAIGGVSMYGRMF
jgi:hypothetical protein